MEELTAKVKELTLDNATLKAEVDMYRKEAALPSFSKLALGQAPSDEEMETMTNLTAAEFISSGNDVYPTDPAVSLPNTNGLTNPLCCALNGSDTILAVGGADSYLTVMTWGAALAPNPDAATNTVSKAARVQCNAPIICVDFCPSADIICVGCMDGSVNFIGFNLLGGIVSAWTLKNIGEDIKFTKYVKAVAWSNSLSSQVIACSSADGTVILSNISLVDADAVMDDDENEYRNEQVTVTMMKSFHFKGAVETLCFVKDGQSLCLYERDTSFLTYFDLSNEYNMTRYSLNGKTNGGFDDFVSFAVMQLSLSPNGKYLCAATDTSRNIIIEIESDNILRDLYGHKNDSFSNPKVAWSSSGQYIFGNTQEDSSICVWDVASSKIVKKLSHHSGQIRDIFSSKTSDTLATASYDKSCTIWLNAM